jgi:hypothetical protein
MPKQDTAEEHTTGKFKKKKKTDPKVLEAKQESAGPNNFKY